MQTTLDCTAPASAVNVEAQNSTLLLNDAHIEYIYAHSFEGMLKKQIEQHLEEEENHQKDIREEFEYLQQFDEFKPKQKPTEYIRVGKR